MNCYIEKIKPSASMDLMNLAKDMKNRGEDIVNLSGGEPDFDTPSLIKDEVIRQINANNTHYLVGKGLLELRECIADKLHQDNSIEYSPEDIIVTPGAKYGIYLAVRSIVNEGDEVLIPTPSWVSYTEIVRASGAVPIEVPLEIEDNYKLTEKALREKLTDKTVAIIICSPNNPTGRILNKDELEVLRKIATENNLIIISDEIYEKIAYHDNRIISPAAYDELFDRTLTINGFSKAFAMTGWRLGYIAGPSPIMNQVNRLFTHTITGTPPFIQAAAVKAFDCYDHVEHMRQEFERREEFFISELKKIPCFEVNEPEGAFYAWVRVNGVEKPSEYILNNARVVCVPGEAYGSGFENFVRFSFATGMVNLEEAVRRLKQTFC